MYTVKDLKSRVVNMVFTHRIFDGNPDNTTPVSGMNADECAEMYDWFVNLELDDDTLETLCDHVQFAQVFEGSDTHAVVRLMTSELAAAILMTGAV